MAPLVPSLSRSLLFMEHVIRKAGCAVHSSKDFNSFLQENFKGVGLNKKVETLWGCGVGTVLCLIWTERNNRIYEEKE